MPVTLYESTIPMYVRLLKALSNILDKGAAHAAAGKFKEEVLVTSRLYPDMWTLAQQVFQATSIVTRGTARLAAIAIPTLDDKSATIADLKARIAATIAFLEGVDRSAIDAGLDRDITFPAGDSTRTMRGWDYFQSFTLPNFYFALTTAYNILRHNGVKLEKADFLGAE